MQQAFGCHVTAFHVFGVSKMEKRLQMRAMCLSYSTRGFTLTIRAALQSLKRQEQQQEAEADAAIAAYAQCKEALEADRRRQQEAAAAAKEVARQRNIAALQAAFLKVPPGTTEQTETPVGGTA
jgi:hypothetical protein